MLARGLEFILELSPNFKYECKVKLAWPGSAQTDQCEASIKISMR